MSNPLQTGKIWCRACKKPKYLTVTIAERVRNRAEYKYDKKLRIYPCDEGGFHLTGVLWNGGQ